METSKHILSTSAAAALVDPYVVEQKLFKNIVGKAGRKFTFFVFYRGNW